IGTIHVPEQIAIETINPLSRMLTQAVEDLKTRHVGQLEIVRAAVAAVEEASRTAMEMIDMQARSAGATGQVPHALGRIRQVMRDLARFIIALGGDRQSEQAQLLSSLQRLEGSLRSVLERLERESEAA